MIEPAYVYRAELVRVIDGDTYELNLDLGLRVHAVIPIRLLHIDVYEHNTPLGQQATKFVTDMLTGQPLLVQTHKDEQTFARYLADIWLPNGDLLSDVLKQAGFAKPDSPWNKTSYTAEEYTPEIKRRKAEGEEVTLGRCSNCHQQMVIPSGLCIQCGHHQARIGT